MEFDLDDKTEERVYPQPEETPDVQKQPDNWLTGMKSQESFFNKQTPHRTLRRHYPMSGPSIQNPFSRCLKFRCQHWPALPRSFDGCHGDVGYRPVVAIAESFSHSLIK